MKREVWESDIAGISFPLRVFKVLLATSMTPVVVSGWRGRRTMVMVVVVSSVMVVIMGPTVVGNGTSCTTAQQSGTAKQWQAQ